ncbi:MAG TPA: MotA/TolQ/ExbB proton channel family protein, partial [Solirubrobacteraceae bacterium]|nr:MotA/TolQ/ExbB proton channel family protein [Solirubrobacteraceae bacterium]
MMPFASVEDVIFHVANALRIPVLVAALVALALVLVEAGALGVEIYRRRRRHRTGASTTGLRAREALDAGDASLASRQLATVASSERMWATLQALVSHAGDGTLASSRMAKCLADYDLNSMRRLERTRMLVRIGPALGLMGTLIPLAPALSGLAEGNVAKLTDNLRVAFSVTVLGLLIGATAFAISLVRDRLYAQDLSDMEAVAAELEGG